MHTSVTYVRYAYTKTLTYTFSVYIGQLSLNDTGHMSIRKRSQIADSDTEQFCIFQAVCDHQFAFTNVVCRWPGSTNDLRKFRQSVLCHEFENGIYMFNVNIDTVVTACILRPPIQSKHVLNARQFHNLGIKLSIFG